jgi:transposase
MGAATLPLNIAVAGRPHTLGLTTRKDRHHDGSKSSNRSYGWVVERTLAWTSRYRRLSKDSEFLPATSEVWIYLSMIRLMLKRLGHEQIQPAFHYRRVA